MPRHLALLLLAFSAAATAAEPPPFPYPSDLPPQHEALAAIRNAPAGLTAAAVLSAEAENRQRLEAGPHEWTARLNSQQRRLVPVDERFAEWQLALERGFRLPGKAALDERLGAQGEAVARAARNDALHETGRQLLKGWFGWLREKEGLRQWQRQSESLTRQRQITGRRVQLGDAPKLELMQSEAAAAQAEAALEQARLKETMAAAELAARFPRLALPAGLVPSEPLPLEASDWKQHLLEHDHGLKLARAESEQSRLVARRSDAERVPDPSIGVHLGSDRGGEERITGVTLAIPLPGQAREATARRDAAYASAAASKEAGVLARVNGEVAVLLAGASAAYESWRRAEDAAQRMEQAATLMSRAYQLGEAGLSEVLTAQRQANEARLAAQYSRLEALEKRYQVYLDSHVLWPADTEQ